MANPPPAQIQPVSAQPPPPTNQPVQPPPTNPRKRTCCILVLAGCFLIFIAFFGWQFIRFLSGGEHDIPIPSSTTKISTTTTKGKPSKSTTTKPASTQTSLASFTKEQAIDYFIDVAVTDEEGNSRVVVKWTKLNVSLKVTGSPDSDSNSCVNSVISDINGLSSSMKLAKTDGASDIEVNFTTQADIQAKKGAAEPNSYGYMKYSQNDDNSLKSAIAWIATDSGLASVYVCHIIRHEMTHTIGLRFNSGMYDYSIFNVAAGTSDYISIDRELIKMMYNSGIGPGLNENQARDFLNSANW